MIQQINSYSKEGILNAFQTSRGKHIRPFDIILAKSSNDNHSSEFTELFDIEDEDDDKYNICGIIINKYILDPILTNDAIHGSLNHVLYSVNDNELIIDEYDTFIEKYGFGNVLIKKLKKNILDELNINVIQKKMNKIYTKYNNKYDFIGIIFKTFNIIIDCPEIFKNKCITFDKFSFQNKFV